MGKCASTWWRGIQGTSFPHSTMLGAVPCPQGRQEALCLLTATETAGPALQGKLPHNWHFNITGSHISHLWSATWRWAHCTIIFINSSWVKVLFIYVQILPVSIFFLFIDTSWEPMKVLGKPFPFKGSHHASTANKPNAHTQWCL